MESDIKWREPFDWWRLNWKKNQERLILFEENGEFCIELMSCFYHRSKLPHVFMPSKDPLAADLVEAKPENWTRFAIVC